MTRLALAMLAACGGSAAPLENRTVIHDEDWSQRVGQLCALVGRTKVAQPPLAGIHYVAPARSTEAEEYGASTWFVAEPAWIHRVTAVFEKTATGHVAIMGLLDTALPPRDVCRALHLEVRAGSCVGFLTPGTILVIGDVRGTTQVACQVERRPK